MSTLYVYADEAGTMPMSDDDEPFVAATVSSLAPIAGVGNLRYSVPLLIEHLARTGAQPFLGRVRPTPGYGRGVAAKFGKMNAMARARRLVTRVHGYLPAGGLAFRNILWSQCVTGVVAQAAAKAAFRGPINNVVVTFHPKSLAPEDRRMVIDMCRSIPSRLHEVTAGYRQLNPRQVEDVLANLRVGMDGVLVQWSDEDSAHDTEDGLRLADRLAGHYRRHLMKPNRYPLLRQLGEAGYAAVTLDVTPLVLNPIDRESIERWKHDTGLPEP